MIQEKITLRVLYRQLFKLNLHIIGYIIKTYLNEDRFDRWRKLLYR